MYKIPVKEGIDRLTADSKGNDGSHPEQSRNSEAEVNLCPVSAGLSESRHEGDC